MSNTTHSVQNRSEIIFGFDAEGCNPNGNPMSDDNDPRIDRNTGQCVVTDVRIKRYIRDQFIDDGADIYVRKVNDQHVTREELFEDVIPLDKMQDALDGNIDEDPADIFLDAAIDVRLFGAAMSISDVDIADEFMDVSRGEFTGAVQLTPSRSLNSPVQLNTEYDSLTSVIATNKSKDGGGYGLADKRIKYGFFPVYGVVNETVANKNNVRHKDIEKLDSVFWRSLRNQTLTRSKIGQTPRFYMRVEYEGGYHYGNIHNLIGVSEHSEDPAQLRRADQFVPDMTKLVDMLGRNDRVATVHAHGVDYLPFGLDGETVKFNQLLAVLEQRGVETENVDPYA